MLHYCVITKTSALNQFIETNSLQESVPADQSFHFIRTQYIVRSHGYTFCLP